MKKEKIKEVLELMCDSIEQKEIELYEKLIDERCYENIDDFQEFYHGLIYPHEQFINGLIKSEISPNRDVGFILKHSNFLENNFRCWIEKVEGSACCADKTRTIIRNLIDFYKTGNKIDFDYNQEYTFHLPKVVFKNHESIVEFYEGIKSLYYGNPTKYLLCLKNLIESD
jgi:hypothetical protein